MADRPPAFEGANLGLVLAVVALTFAAGMILTGPGSDRIETARQTVLDHEKRIETWGRQQDDSAPVTESEQQAWDEHYGRLARFGALEEDETALMAWVATRLSAPSVHDLQVSRTADPDAEDDDERSDENVLRARAPDGHGSWELRPVPLHVRFDASYADVSHLLRRLEGQLSPLRIERLDLRRRYPDVRVEFDLTLWTRREASS